MFVLIDEMKQPVKSPFHNEINRVSSLENIICNICPPPLWMEDATSCQISSAFKFTVFVNEL